jgi:hypothetical protein
LSASRIQLGYGFGFLLGTPIVNWVDFMPKMGITSIEFTIKEPSDFSPPTSYSFKLRQAPSLGFEIGAERRSNDITARGWLFGNFSIGLSTLEKGNKTSSLKYGIDFFKDLGELLAIKTALLVFLSRETTVIEKSQPGASQSDLLRYRSLHLGLGITASW